MSLQVLMIFPPIAYPYMPYMAPYLLKGHVEKNSNHVVRCVDWNIEFYDAVWSGSIFSNFRSEISELDSNWILSSELASSWGTYALSKLRDQGTYDSHTPETISAYHSILRIAKKLVDHLDLQAKVPVSPLPRIHESWSDIVESFERSVAAQFARQMVYETTLADTTVIGLCAAYVEQIPHCLLIAKQLKQIKPELTIVIGGGAFTHILNAVLTDSSFWTYIDVGIPYEGEHSFLELLDAIAAKGDIGLLSNIVSYKNSTAIYKKALAERPKVVAIPDYQEVSQKFPTPVPVIPILTSKGCYWGKCAFCTHHEGYGEGYFAFGMDQVRLSIETLVERGHDHFYLVDEALPPKMVWKLADIIRDIRQSQNRSLRWMAESRAEKNFCGDDYVKALQESGCKLLFNGIESGVQRIVDLMKKGIDLETASKLLEKCKKSGIRTGWMFFIGFPGESEDEAQGTFDFIRENANFLDYATVGLFSLENGAPISNSPKEWGIVPKPKADDKYQLIIPYALEEDDQNVILRRHKRKLLAELLKRNDDLAELFGRLPERSTGLFMPPTNPEEHIETMFEWDSYSYGKVAIFNATAGSVALRPRRVQA